jgi:hypothetical protein
VRSLISHFTAVYDFLVIIILNGRRDVEDKKCLSTMFTMTTMLGVVNSFRADRGCVLILYPSPEVMHSFTLPHAYGASMAGGSFHHYPNTSSFLLNPGGGVYK